MKRLQKILVRKKRKNESYLKYLIALFHLWLGLLSSVIIFIVCLTGSIYAFKNQILDFFIEDVSIISVEKNKSILENSIKTFTNEYEKPTAIWIKENSIEITSFAKNNIGTYAYFDINTANLIGTRNPKFEYFFEIVLQLHRYLLVENTGKLIVGISVLFFTYLLISGLIMWFPKRRKQLKQALTINFRLKIKRINYDLHRVLGFYSFLLLLFISITGLYVSFYWFKNLNIQALGGPSITINEENIGKNGLSAEISSSFNTIFNDLTTTKKNQQPKKVDELLAIAKKKISNYTTVSINVPLQKTGYYSFKFFRKGLCSLSVYDEVIINQFGIISEVKRFNDLKTHQQYMLIVKPLHTGEIFGTPSIILYFFISLVGCSLPITGFVIWYSKIKKTPYS